MRCAALVGLLGLLGSWVVGCSSGTTSAVSGPPVYVLSVSSLANNHETITSISPADISGTTAGTTQLQLFYKPGATVTLTAAASDNSGAFLGWCDASSANTTPFKCVAPACTQATGLSCTVTMNSNINLLATYPGVTGVTITPLNNNVTYPATVQFTVTVNGIGTYVDGSGNTQTYQGSPYNLSLTGPSTYTGALGTTTSTGLYVPPFPAPPTGTILTIKATSTVFPTATNFATLTINVPTGTTGPALTVDVGSPTHTISPNIYGINDYGLDKSVFAAINLPIERWGGDDKTRYNYLVDATNSASDYYFENNFPSAQGYPVMSRFNSQVTQDRITNTKTIVSVPLTGYVSQRTATCGYSVAKYGAQTSVDPNNKDCGTGTLITAVNGSTTIKNDPTDTSVAINQNFVGNWTQFLVGQFGTAANGGVGFYSLDNEPEYWSGVHKDVHPNPVTYDELTNKGIAYSAAIKAQDPSALVTGPVISNWTGYFYSAADISSGYSTSPYCPQANPTDRLAHGDTPLIEYYLAQFQKYQTANSTRLLDYVDIHTYFAAQGAGGSNTLAGNLLLQQARLNSTRVFWDSTYTDPNYTDPTDTATTRACNGQPYPPNLINTMKGWVSRNYPGTKLAISEYNWGGQESINGALAQADILGIFGREGLDLATLWGPPAPTTQNSVTVQMPGILAFAAYTNYDGNGSHFGETAVTSTSANQGLLSVYGATRAVDGKLTVVVINKGYLDLTATLSLPNLKPNGNAQAYLYSNSNLTAIVAQSTPVTVTATAGSSTGASLSSLFPAQSITVLVIPKM
jgi:hypothetical protein